jgi:hypothetical protein
MLNLKSFPTDWRAASPSPSPSVWFGLSALAGRPRGGRALPRAGHLRPTSSSSLTSRVGFDAFITEQFARPAPVFPPLVNWPQNPPSDCDSTCQRDNYSMYPLQAGAFQAFMTSPDQLRLRVAFALNQIFVVSAVDANLRQPSRMLPYLQVLANGAFGNFRQLLTDITLNPAMGRYLDSVNNNKESPN